MSNTPLGPPNPNSRPPWPGSQPFTGIPPQANPFADAGVTPNPYAPPANYARSTPIGEDPAMRWVLPVGTSIWAIAAGYCGLISLAVCFLGPIAVVCGIMAIRDIRSNPRIGGMGRAIFGIVTGLLGSLGLALLIVVLASGR